MANIPARGMRLLHAYLIGMLVVALVFCVFALGNWVYSTNILIREKTLVNQLLPELNSSYQLTAVTAGLQSKGLLLGSSSTTQELEVRRLQLAIDISLMRQSIDDLTAVDRRLSASIGESLDDISQFVKRLANTRLQQIASQSHLSRETGKLIESLLVFDNEVRQRVVQLTEELLDNSTRLVEISAQDELDSNKLKRLEENVSRYELINLAIQDNLLFVQDLVSLSALVERVPLLSDMQSVTVAEQSRDLLVSALVTRAIYMDGDSSQALLLKLRNLRENLTDKLSVFRLKDNILAQESLQISIRQSLREKTDVVLDQTEQLRNDSTSTVSRQAQLTLHGLDQYRRVLLLISAVVLLGLAGMSYWLLYRKTVLPLLQITRQLDNVGTERYPEHSQHYFLRELSTLSSAMRQLDNAQKSMLAQDARMQLINRDLNRVNEELGQFAHVASHDLQEPLRKLQQFSDILQEDYHAQLDDEGKYFLDTIRTSAERMSTLIKETLAFSRAGSLNQVLEPVDLSQLVLQLRDEMDLIIQEVEADVQIDELPVVNANALGMAQLFRNLMVNAFKYRKPDMPASLAISVDRHHESVCINVTDKGVGINKKYHERIFVPFERVHAGKIQGTGLGLAICRKVCDSHNWELDVKSTSDVGTTFKIHIPQSSVLEVPE